MSNAVPRPGQRSAVSSATPALATAGGRRQAALLPAPAHAWMRRAAGAAAVFDGWLASRHPPSAALPRNPARPAFSSNVPPLASTQTLSPCLSPLLLHSVPPLCLLSSCRQPPCEPPTAPRSRRRSTPLGAPRPAELRPAWPRPPSTGRAPAPALHCWVLAEACWSAQRDSHACCLCCPASKDCSRPSVRRRMLAGSDNSIACY